ncbi:hypothetical protein JRQ81_009136 [Phrynocephalus forsythii]|uniref:Uncharacterized protein n=1 Tax=Phrynocephalus forsythii TaxID=171643 RepID=A0A9Q0X9H1_9SAUR|nr:hypothetical protein JRQ81_009136 [Phrynocephalus forsythii]
MSKKEKKPRVEGQLSEDVRTFNQTKVMDFIIVGFLNTEHFHLFLFFLLFVIYLLTILGNLMVFTAIHMDPHLLTPMYIFSQRIVLLGDLVHHDHHA